MRIERALQPPRGHRSRSLAPAFLSFVLASGSVTDLVGQLDPSRASVSGFVGVTTASRSAAFLAGIEARMRVSGRVFLAASGSAWRIAAGCDLLIGTPCDERATGFDAGPVVRLTSPNISWALEGTARVGRLWYAGHNRGVWSPSIGLGLALGTRQRLGGYLDLRYFILGSNRPADEPYRPSTDNGPALLLGLQLRL